MQRCAKGFAHDDMQKVLPHLGQLLKPLSTAEKKRSPM
jgi:hypothetical protein